MGKPWGGFCCSLLPEQTQKWLLPSNCLSQLDQTTVVTPALVTRLDYWNTLYVGLPLKTVQMGGLVQNAAVSGYCSEVVCPCWASVQRLHRLPMQGAPRQPPPPPCRLPFPHPKRPLGPLLARLLRHELPPEQLTFRGMAPAAGPRREARTREADRQAGRTDPSIAPLASVRVRRQHRPTKTPDAQPRSAAGDATEPRSVSTKGTAARKWLRLPLVFFTGGGGMCPFFRASGCPKAIIPHP